MKKPQLPMSPSQLPKQRIVALADLAERPEPFESVVGYEKTPPGVDYDKPRGPTYVGQVEWSWSPMHGRIDAYYLHKGRRFWMLWLALYDDNWEEWNWQVIGYVPCGQATRAQAAVHLLTDFWRFEREQHNREHYHWINETGELSSSELRTIGTVVWPSGGSRRRP